jgi:hypothetical protein
MHTNPIFDYLDLLSLVARHELACAALRAFITEFRAGTPRPLMRTALEADADQPVPTRGRSAPAWHFWCRECGWSWLMTPAEAAGRGAVLCCGRPVACFWGDPAGLPRPEDEGRRPN